MTHDPDASFSLYHGTYPIVLAQISEVFKAADVDIRLLCGMRTRPAVAGMVKQKQAKEEGRRKVGGRSIG